MEVATEQGGEDLILPDHAPIVALAPGHGSDALHAIRTTEAAEGTLGPLAGQRKPQRAQQSLLYQWPEDETSEETNSQPEASTQDPTTSAGNAERCKVADLHQWFQRGENISNPSKRKHHSTDCLAGPLLATRDFSFGDPEEHLSAPPLPIEAVTDDTVLNEIGGAEQHNSEELAPQLIDQLWMIYHGLADDGTGADRLMDANEFVRGMGQLGLEPSDQGARAEFAKIDGNHGGQLHGTIEFPKFLSYVRKRVNKKEQAKATNADQKDAAAQASKPGRKPRRKVHLKFEFEHSTVDRDRTIELKAITEMEAWFAISFFQIAEVERAWMEVAISTEPPLTPPDIIAVEALVALEKALRQRLPTDIQQKVLVRRFSSVDVSSDHPFFGGCAIVAQMSVSSCREMRKNFCDKLSTPIDIPLPTSFGGGDVRMTKIAPGDSYWWMLSITEISLTGQYFQELINEKLSQLVRKLETEQFEPPHYGAACL